MLCGSVLMPGGTAIGTAAGTQAVPAIVEAHDLFDALDADVERCRRLRRATRCRTSRAGRAAGRRGRGSAPFRRRRSRSAGLAVDDPAAQPLALVGQREEMLAVGRDAQRRQPAEIAEADDSSTSPPRNCSAPKRVRVGSRGSNASIGLRHEFQFAGRLRRHASAAPPPGSRRERERPGQAEPREIQCCEQVPSFAVILAASRARHDHPAARAATSQAIRCSLRRARRAAPRGSAAACSSNSSASFSVIAPPSSSASTMVTARR